MDNYLAIVFDSDEKASAGLHRLWALDDSCDITAHGAAVIHRDKFGRLDVATKDTDPGLRTVVGVGLGALLGALAGPVGTAAGATVAMRQGQAAVIAEVSEDWTTPVDTAMKTLGGTVYRRSKGAVRDSSFFGDDYADYLYPYDYDPHFAS